MCFLRGRGGEIRCRGRGWRYSIEIRAISPVNIIPRLLLLFPFSLLRVCQRHFSFHFIALYDVHLHTLFENEKAEKKEEKTHNGSRGVRDHQSLSSLAILEAMFLKPMEVPEMRLKRTPFRDRRGSLQTWKTIIKLYFL